METFQKSQNCRTRKKSIIDYRCSECMYTSSRRFNVIRHEFRIHSARPRKCCGISHKTKADYYLHCEKNHPDSRLTNKTSRNKYKILADCTISPESSKKTSSVTPYIKSQEIPYMLRNRVQRNILQNPKPLESSDESVLEDSPTVKSPDSQLSSGYETKTSSTFESIDEKCKTSSSCSEENDELKMILREDEFPCSEDTSETAIEESTETFHIDVPSRIDEKFYSSIFTSTPCHLPLKKRILLNFELSNRENIENSREPIDDRSCPEKPLNIKKTSLRKKHRLSKKMRRRKLQNTITLTRYSSASSDTENLTPLITKTRKQKAPEVKVELLADGGFGWNEVTPSMRDYLVLIDFDSFETIPRGNEQRTHENMHVGIAGGNIRL